MYAPSAALRPHDLDLASSRARLRGSTALSAAAEIALDTDDELEETDFPATIPAGFDAGDDYFFGTRHASDARGGGAGLGMDAAALRG
jgi:hypothetical protein